MSGLGSIFEETDDAVPVGKDLRWNVVVSPRVVGTAEPAVVRVPLRLPDDDGYVVPRRPNPADQGDTLRLQIPDVSFPVQLRLRGMGGEHPEGRPGDLFLTVSLGDVPAVRGAAGLGTRRWAGIGVGLVALLAAALAVCG